MEQKTDCELNVQNKDLALQVLMTEMLGRSVRFVIEGKPLSEYSISELKAHLERICKGEP